MKKYLQYLSFTIWLTAQLALLFVIVQVMASWWPFTDDQYKILFFKKFLLVFIKFYLK